MRKNDSEMLLVYVDGTYANSYVKIGSSSVPLSSLRSVLNWKHCPRPWKPDLNPKSSIQHLLKSTLIRGKEEENMFMSKYNSDILESFSEEIFLDDSSFHPLRPEYLDDPVLFFERTRYKRNMKKETCCSYCPCCRSKLFVWNVPSKSWYFRRSFQNDIV